MAGSHGCISSEWIKGITLRWLSLQFRYQSDRVVFLGWNCRARTAGTWGLPRCPVKADSALNFKFIISVDVFMLCYLPNQPNNHFACTGCSLSSWMLFYSLFLLNNTRSCVTATGETTQWTLFRACVIRYTLHILLSKMNCCPVAFLLLIVYVFHTSVHVFCVILNPTYLVFITLTNLDEQHTHTTKFLDLYVFVQFTGLIVPACENSGYWY
jgi:hypothetical protein